MIDVNMVKKFDEIVNDIVEDLFPRKNFTDVGEEFYYKVHRLQRMFSGEIENLSIDKKAEIIDVCYRYFAETESLNEKIECLYYLKKLGEDCEKELYELQEIERLEALREEEITDEEENNVSR